MVLLSLIQLTVYLGQPLEMATELLLMDAVLNTMTHLHYVLSVLIGHSHLSIKLVYKLARLLDEPFPLLLVDFSQSGLVEIFESLW